MSRDDDSESRRKISNAFLDRRQDSLDHFRHQQRLTRTVYGRDKSAARAALGVQSSPGGVDEVAPGASVLDEMRRYRLMVCEEIDACRDNHFVGRWIAGCDSLRARIEADHFSHGEVGFELVTSWSSRCI